MSDFEINGICLEKYHGSAETVIIPENVRVIGEYAFAHCESVRTVLVPGGLYEIGWHAFLHCCNLETVTLPDNLYAIAADAFCGCTSLEHFTVPEGIWTLGSRTFKICPNLKTLTVPDSVSEMVCFANLENRVIICAHKGSMAETLTERAGFRFQPLAGTVKEGFHPAVSYNGTVIFYNPSKGIRRHIIENGFFLRDQSPGYELPGTERTPYFERTYTSQRMLRRLIFSRTDSGYRADMTFFLKGDRVQKEFDTGRIDFYAFLNDEGRFTSAFKPLPDGVPYCLDSRLEAYQEYLMGQKR